MSEQKYDIPAQCKAGVVVNEGPDFHVEVVDVDVPKYAPLHPSSLGVPC